MLPLLPRRLLLLSFVGVCTFCHAQDTHYASNQFGARSALMGGAVVGGMNDNTAIFYNPGALAFTDTGTLSINANLYQMENIRIKNAVGNEKDFQSNSLASLPLLLSGSLRTRNTKLRLGYGLINPIGFQFKASARIDEKVQVTEDAESPGPEAFLAQTGIETKLSEVCGILGAAYRINNRLAIGLSNMVTARSHSFSRSTLTRVLLNDAQATLVSSDFLRSTSYFQLRYAPKIGIAFTGQHIELGLSITPPAIAVFGRGTVLADLTGNNVLLNNKRGYVLANDQQERLRTRYRAPMSLAAGINFKRSKSLVGFTAEYHFRIKPYDVLRANPAVFVRPPELYSQLGSDKFLRVLSANKPVFNVSLGYEYRVKPELTFNTSFRTNFSFYDKDLTKLAGLRPEFTSWDIFHYTVGGSFRRGRSSISAGLLTAWGKDRKHASSNSITQPNENNLLQGTLTLSEARYFNLGGLLGFTYTFKRSEL